VAAGIVAIGVVDHTGTVSAMRDVSALQAAALREAVVAAARNNHAAARAAEEELGRRLLDNARLLKMLDSRNRLTEPMLQRVAASNNLFRLLLRRGRPAADQCRPPAGIRRRRQDRDRAPGHREGRSHHRRTRLPVR
jgi:hypothetical protein